MADLMPKAFSTSQPLGGAEITKNMGFLRNWDSCCPHVWDSWKGEDGVTWVIRDLRPEDDEDALKILMEHMCADEVLCSLSNIVDDPESMRSIREFWRDYLKHRMSLGCYEEKEGLSKLVALNACYVICRGDKSDDVIEGKAWNNVYNALKLCDEVDPLKVMDIDMILYAVGLVVHKDYRGAKLGARILAAREPLALHHCILGTSTVFTGPASQKSAVRAGFTTALTLTLKQLADAGLDYPKDESKSIKLMVKKYNGKVVTRPRN